MTIKREAISKYPYVNNYYGINFARFDETEGEQELSGLTGSGRKIDYRLNKYGISAHDPFFFPFHLRGYELAASMINDETICFSLYTIWCGIRHHPDMFAKIFVELAVNHFEENGYDVNSWRDAWYPYSINYKKYIHGLKKGLSPTEAAAQTWSGIQANKLGFRPEAELSPTYKEDGARLFKFVRK